jgi:hypothetical protein
MWLRRRKALSLTESLIQFTESVLDAAVGSCTRCLMDELCEENAELPVRIARLQLAYETRGESPERATEFGTALAQFVTHSITIAVFTGELLHRPGVRLTDENTDIHWPAVSPN